MHVWITIYDLTSDSTKWYDYWAILVYVASCAVYVAPASLIANVFDEYQGLLFKYGDKFMDNKIENELIEEPF